jgi:regulator of sigma D
VDSPYQQARELAQKLYTRIARTTQAALAFHDRYDGDPSDPALAKLDEELSRLGESLAARIELEDQIVAAVRNSRRRTSIAA